MESHLRPGFWSSRALCWPRRHRARGRSGRDPPELLAGVDVGAQVRLVHCFRLQKSFLKPGSRVRRSLGEPSCRSITPSHPPVLPSSSPHADLQPYGISDFEQDRPSPRDDHLPHPDPAAPPTPPSQGCTRTWAQRGQARARISSRWWPPAPRRWPWPPSRVLPPAASDATC